MKIDESVMLDLIREEYEKRVNYFLNLSEIEVKDKDDNDLISSAIGLKVKDKAGFMYTIQDVFNDESGNVMVKLLQPGEGLIDQSEISSTTPIYEYENEDERKTKKGKSESGSKEKDLSYSPETANDIIPKSKDVDYKRSFTPDMKNSPELGRSNGEDLIISIEDLEKKFSL
jgi:hypothetical protein